MVDHIGPVWDFARGLGEIQSAMRRLAIAAQKRAGVSTVQEGLSFRSSEVGTSALGFVDVERQDGGYFSHTVEMIFSAEAIWFECERADCDRDGSRETVEGVPLTECRTEAAIRAAVTTVSSWFRGELALYP